MAAFIIAIWVVASIIVGTLVGSHKGRGGTGFVLALLLGWIGVIIVACLSPSPDEQVRRMQQQMFIQQEAQRRMLAQPGLPPQGQQPNWSQRRGYSQPAPPQWGDR